MEDRRVVMAKQAESHNKRAEVTYKDLIQKTYENTKVYTEFSTFRKSQNPKKAEVIISSNNIYETLQEYHKEGKVAVVSPASHNTPGGGFLSGNLSQEEILCHYSILYNILTKCKDYYTYNTNHKNKGLYINRALYIPELLFCTKSLTFKANVISCSPPSCTGARFNDIVTKEENKQALKSRINYVLNIANENETDTLVIGPYGCGYFQQNPEDVATIIHDLITVKEYSFSKLVISAPNRYHSIFTNVFNNKKQTMLFT